MCLGRGCVEQTIQRATCTLETSGICCELIAANKGPSSQSYGFSSSHVWM